MSVLVHYIYSSVATRQLSNADLSDLMEKTRANNRNHGVTGILLYIAGSFFQVLEGESSIVEKLYEHIQADPRHADVTLIIHESIARRAFGEWTMAFSFLSEEQLALILDVSGVGDKEHSVSRLKEQRTRKLLQAFSEGRWRGALRATVPQIDHLNQAVGLAE